METEILPLTENERRFKELYENDGEKYLQTSMTLSEYRSLPDKRRIMDKIISTYHVENRSAEDINTIRDIRLPGSDDMIHLSIHGRYSYPLLHNHDYIELIYVWHGQCTHFVNHAKFEMHTGDFCILSPNTVHAISAVHDDDIILNIIVSKSFFGSSFMKLLRKEPAITDFFESIFYHKGGIPYILYPTGSDETFHSLVTSLYRESLSGTYLYNESMSLYVRLIFTYLLRHYETNAVIANPMNNSQDDNIVPLISYISANYDHITLNSTAALFGYNVAYLSQLLRHCTGKSFSMMVNEIQMRNAMSLLSDTSLPVTEIAYRVGCYDASHFVRKFKTAFHMTPTQFRKQIEAACQAKNKTQ
jgi:AraC-like DNA-binding protein